ncbi:MAG: peptidylprolyl isomerase [Nitrospinae bacterium]|nr:peptidylprolyl isomerase [Nitrospinota bacterium]MBL7020068.1 peptidylprolyl isomerase [Nitrospinaceae bacterium]
MISLKKLIEAGFVLLLLSLLLFPLVVHAKVFDKVAAKVNTEIITLSSVEERAELLRQKYSRSPVGVPQRELLKEALNMIIEERLQLQAGKKLGFIIDEESIDAAVRDILQKNGLVDGQLQQMLEREGRSMSSYRDNIRDQIMVSKIARFEIGNRVKVSDKDIDQYYNAHQKEFWEDGQVRARHILFIAERGSSETNRRAKLKQAKKVLSEIRKGGDFAELAKKYSEDVSASDGGDVGFVVRGKMVREFEEAVFNLKQGQISEIVETEYGYHIIKVDEILAGKTLTFKDAKVRISEILAMEKQKQGYADWMKELKKAAFIEVNLFAEPDKNASNLSKDSDEKKTGRSEKVKTDLNSGAVSRQQSLQKKWEEMYRSVEKSKADSGRKEGSQLESLEDKLKHIKKLRDQNRISEQEYRERKEKLLNRL